MTLVQNTVMKHSLSSYDKRNHILPTLYTDTLKEITRYKVTPPNPPVAPSEQYLKHITCLTTRNWCSPNLSYKKALCHLLITYNKCSHLFIHHNIWRGVPAVVMLNMTSDIIWLNATSDGLCYNTRDQAFACMKIKTACHWRPFQSIDICHWLCFSLQILLQEITWFHV